MDDQTLAEVVQELSSEYAFGQTYQLIAKFLKDSEVEQKELV